MMDKLNFLILLLCFAVLAPLSVRADDSDSGPPPVFEHSANAQRTYEQHQDTLTKLAAGYEQSMQLAAGRFESACEKHIKLYGIALRKQVRELTRADKIEDAKATQDLAEKAEAWQISTPDAQGRHFLTEENLEVEGNEKVNKLGVDLLVQVEQAGGAYSKQGTLVFERYKKAVLAARSDYARQLSRVLDREKQAGRLDAVQEVRAAIDALAKPAEVDQPDARGGDEASSEAEEEKPDEAKQPAYTGFYIVEYTEGTQDKRTYFLELTEQGGMVHYQRWPRFKGIFKARVDWPIQELKVEEDRLTFQHRMIAIQEPMKHEMRLEDGAPVFDAMAYSGGNMKGKVTRLGTPGADLLGLKDGTYTLELTQHENPFQKKPGTPAHLRLVINKGIVVWDATDWGGKGNYAKRNPHVMTVETKSDKLHLQLDARTRFNPRDNVMVIDMSQKPAKVSFWWYKPWYQNGRSPSMTGVLKNP